MTVLVIITGGINCVEVRLSVGGVTAPKKAADLMEKAPPLRCLCLSVLSVFIYYNTLNCYKGVITVLISIGMI